MELARSKSRITITNRSKHSECDMRLGYADRAIYRSPEFKNNGFVVRKQTHLDGSHHACTSQLCYNHLHVVLVMGFDRIRFDAPHVVNFRSGDFQHQFSQRSLELNERNPVTLGECVVEMCVTRT